MIINVNGRFPKQIVYIESAAIAALPTRNNFFFMYVFRARFCFTAFILLYSIVFMAHDHTDSEIESFL